MVSFLVANYLMKFATDEILIAPATVGLIFALSRIWDAISDPLCGHLSDKTTATLGRRRTWLFYSVPVLLFSFFFLWITPKIPAFTGSASGILYVFRTGWFAFWLFALFTGMTMLYVPHYSLGAELSTARKDRSRIFGVRSIFENFGTILGVAVVALLTEKILPPAAFIPLIVGLAVFLALTILPPVFTLKEQNTVHRSGDAHFFLSFIAVWRNHKTRLVLFVTLLCQTGATIMLASVLYFSEYVLKNQALGGRVAAIFLLTATAAVPLWVKVINRLGIRIPWLSGLILLSLGFLFLVPAGLWYPEMWVYFITVWIGFAAGAVLTIQPVALAESMGDGRAQDNHRTGIYFAVFTFVNKSAMGAAAFLIGLALQLSGFKAGALQTALAQQTIRFLFTVGPFLCFLVAAILVWRSYRLSGVSAGQY